MGQEVGGRGVSAAGQTQIKCHCEFTRNETLLPAGVIHLLAFGHSCRIWVTEVGFEYLEMEEEGVL